MATERFPQLVVVGSSAGGIEALGTLLSALPTDFPAPIVIAQHIDPHRPSHLAEILSRRSTLPVKTIERREDLEAGVVYVVPANRHVEINDRTVHLREDQIAGPKPSVDLLLSSAASAYGEGLIAVILSGTGSDGAAGARSVKQSGGTVIIENPETANYPGMPQSLAPTTVDIVSNLDKIGSLLYELLAGGIAPERPDSERPLEAFLDELRSRSGIDFNSYKRPTIQRRLRRRMAATDTQTLQQYIEFLHDHPDEYQRLVNSFLIKVTDFFRDTELFDQLRTQIIPQIVERARRQGEEIRIWSAGCATGEEAYSLGILLCECLGNDLDGFHVRIFATDLDNEAVNFARRGIYQESTLNNLSPELVSKYFVEDEGQYEIRKRVRALMVFGQHDLGQRAPFPHIDLILCRNVLIYFTSELQKRALQLFAFSLRDGGYLVLGKAETTSPLAELFAAEDQLLKIYRRHGERMMIPPARVAESPPATPARGLPGRRQPTGRELARHLEVGGTPRAPADRLLEEVFRQLPVGVVVVDSQYDIQNINGTARQMLAIHGTALGDDFVHLAQTMPSRELRAAIDRVFRERLSSTLPEIEVEDAGSGQNRFLELSVHANVSQGGGTPELALIVVRDVTTHVTKRRELEDASSSSRQEKDQVTAQLERLLETNRDLLDANSELTTVNMELRSANEEFLVDNEEVQAATEEVETLNEELQATNEELETLNEELQATVEELNTTNDDLQARSIELQDLAAVREEQRQQLEEERDRLQTILTSVASALLVVDARGRPVLTNSSYEQMFGSATAELRPSDGEGRPLPEHMTPQRRGAAGESFHMDFTRAGADGERRWYEAHGSPLRSRGTSSQGDGRGPTNGAVIIINDITDRSLLALQQEFLAMISHELRTPLTALHGFLQLLVRPGAASSDDDARQRYLDQASQQARRLSTLINELSDLTRLQTGKLTLHQEDVDLTRLVGNTVDIARSLASGREIGLQVPRNGLTVRGDAGRLEQVLMNLINNAVAHTRPQDKIDVQLRRTGNWAQIRVEDGGPGIAATELPNLFSRYYQVDRESGNGKNGLGLGLYIVKQFVEAHDGTVAVASVVGKGSTFTVRLPVAGASG